MFTVEDVNSVVDELVVNGYHSVDTNLCSLDYFFADFVKVKRTASGFDFRVVNGLWTGGFYCTDSDGEYLDLSSSFSYSDGVLSVVTDESDVVLVLYLCSFFDTGDFDVQYLDCLLEDLDSDIGSVNVSVDDVVSLNGVAVVDGDISVDGGTVSIRGNTFYKDAVILPAIPIVELGDYHCYAGSKSNSVELVSNTSISGVTVYYLGKSAYVEFDDGSGTVELDLTSHTSLDPVPLRVVVDATDDYASLTYEISVTVEYYQATDKSSFITAIQNKVRYIQIVPTYISLDSNITIENDVTILGVNRRQLRINNLNISDGVNIEFRNLILRRVSSTTPILTLGENVNLNVVDCEIVSHASLSSSVPSFVLANEDIDNTNSKVTLTNCVLHDLPMPAIMFDGTLEITDCHFRSNNTSGWYSFSESSLKEEPCFIHMTDGKLTVTNTIFRVYAPNDFVMEGYQICSVLLGENVIFNGVNVTDIDKDTGGKIRSQNHITGVTDGKYKNGNQTIDIDGTFYGAIENKKIIEWK